MALGKKLSCLWTLGLCLVASKPFSLPSITDQSFIDQCVKAHNEMRGKVQPTAANMKHMTWDEGLAKTAKAWANKCIFKHNTCSGTPRKCHPTFDYVGENLWLGGLSIFTPNSAVAAWYNETKYYDYNRQRCSKICGHYTQVVWANSYKVGCAVTLCSNLGRGQTSIFVCNYGPAGNYAKTLPYAKGVSCTMCGKEDTCKNKLCENKERDKLQNYPNWIPQGKAPQQRACHLLYLIYVLLRML
ncbi:GLIPR1-like protein 1 [Rhinolophus ferrumequinum]|uniref:GLIPR1-like protein 1 n=1 Tax=Rhinolophus ferrumequinum TaxID=59479 RepID=UPI00140FE0DB|nr:GLIPR1-like protein 1 [Rhinolophus ferrumequinum]